MAAPPQKKMPIGFPTTAATIPRRRPGRIDPGGQGRGRSEVDKVSDSAYGHDHAVAAYCFRLQLNSATILAKEDYESIVRQDNRQVSRQWRPHS